MTDAAKSREAAPRAGPDAPRRRLLLRLRRLRTWEAVNVVFLPALFVTLWLRDGGDPSWWLRIPPLVMVSFLLVQGTLYWHLKLRSLGDREPLPSWFCRAFRTLRACTGTVLLAVAIGAGRRCRVRIPARRAGCGIALLATLGACADSPAGGGPLVRDSAGVEIVEHGRMDGDGIPRWEPGDTALLRIGATAGAPEDLLYGVEDVRRLADGGVAVLDRSRSLRVFEAGGGLRWSAGREGDGPGEFRSPSLVRQMRGDSLVVWDYSLSRLSVFTPAGDFARSATLTEITGPGMAIGRSDPDHLLLEMGRWERTRIDAHQAQIAPYEFYVFDLELRIRHALGRHVIWTGFEGEGRAFTPAIFEDRDLVAADPEGLWYGDPEQCELHLLGDEGRVSRIVRWEGPDRTVTDADVEAEIERWLELAEGDPARQAAIRRHGRTHPRAERFPAYDRLIVDRTGRLWVRDYVKPHEDDGVRRWTVLSSGGREMLGRLRHRAGFEPYDVGEDWMLGVEKNELDVETVRMYAIERPHEPS